MKRIVLVAACAVIGAGPMAAQAQTKLESVTVSARKREEAAQTVPLAITALSAADLEQQGVEELLDIQYQTPGLFLRPVAGSPSSTILILRGQSQADSLLTTDASVGVYVDGVYVPRQLGLRASLYDIEHVEVVKGPQGTLYGRNTTGGAVSITTAKPSHDGFGGFAEAGYGRFDAWEAGAAVNLPLVADKLAVRLTGQFRDRDGYGRSAFLDEERADDNQVLARVGIMADPNDKVNVSITGEYQRAKNKGAIHQLAYPTAFNLGAGIVPAGVIATAVEIGALNPADIPSGPTFVPGLFAGFDYLQGLVGGVGGNIYTNTAGDPEFAFFEAYGLAATITVDLGWADLKSITGYREFTNNRIIDLDGSPLHIFRGELFSHSSFVSEEVQLVGNSFSDRLEWVLGAFYSSESGHEVNANYALNAINPANPATNDGDVSNSSWAAFAQGTYAITDALRFTAGVRYTEETKKLTSRNFSGEGPFYQCSLPTDPDIRPDPNVCEAYFSDTFDAVSWLFSLDYRLTDTVLAYAKSSRGFRGGGQNLRGSSDPVSFMPFAPETATDFELGIKADMLDQRLRLNLAGYVTKYKEIQRSVIFPTPQGNVVTILTNAAKATISGFEAEATAIPVDGLTLKASASLTDAEYDEFMDIDPVTRLPRDRSDELFAIPKWTYSASARYDLPVGENTLGLQLDWYWQSKVDFSPSSGPGVPASVGVQKAYGLLNARLDFYVEAWDLEVAVFGRNLANEKYFVDFVDFTSTPIGHVVGVVGEPRVWGIQLKKRFGGI
ncbi:MAG: TonB-dependent receptor [Sphingomonadales bacterium]